MKLHVAHAAEGLERQPLVLRHSTATSSTSEKPGQIGDDDPIDVKADAIISPANGFGFMDGGIDAVYTFQFGEGL